MRLKTAAQKKKSAKGKSPKLEIPETIKAIVRKLRRCPKCSYPLELYRYRTLKETVDLFPVNKITTIRTIPGTPKFRVRCTRYPEHDVEGLISNLEEFRLLQWVTEFAVPVDALTEEGDKI